MDPLWWILLAITGFGIGVLAGMFGVGGGFLLTPMLIVLFRVPELVAVGTGLCQMIGVSVAAQVRYLKMGVGEAKLGVLMTIPALLGVTLGKEMASALSRAGNLLIAGREVPIAKLGFSLCYLLLLGGIGVFMAWDLRRGVALRHPPSGPLTRVPFPPFTHLPRTDRRVSIPLMAYTGLALGVLSGLLGVGGGIVLTPLLVYGVGMNMATAAGTGVTLLLATSLIGTFTYAQAGNVNLPIALTLLIGSTFGAQVGALLSRRFEGPRLRWLFVGLIGVTLILIAYDLIKAIR